MEGIHNGLQLVKDGGRQGGVPAVADVLLHLQKIHAGKGGDGGIEACGIADREEAVLTDAVGDQLQGGTGCLGLPKGVVAAEHLVTGIHGVKGLLPPGAILIMLVKTVLKGILTDLVDGIAEKIPAPVFLVVEGVQGGAYARVMHRHPWSMDEKLEIPTAEAAEGMQPGVPPCLQVDLAGKATDSGAAQAVVQMLAVAHVQAAGVGNLQVNIQKSRRLLPQVHNEHNPVAIHGFRRNLSGRAKARIPRFHHVSERATDNGGGLHIHGGHGGAGGVFEASCAADFYGQAGLQDQFLAGTDMKILGNSRHCTAFCKTVATKVPKAVVALHIIVVGRAQLTRYELALSRYVISGFAGQHALVGAGDQVILPVQNLKDQAGLSHTVGGGINAVVPHHHSHAILTHP